MWSDITSVSYVDLDKTLFDSEVVHLLPRDFAVQHGVVCIYKFGAVVTTAMSRPLDFDLINAVESKLGMRISPVFAFPDDIHDAIEIEYQNDSVLEDLLTEAVASGMLSDNIRISDESMATLAEKDSVVAFSWSLLLLAVKEGASDIHIEPEDERVGIRFRVDGVMAPKMSISSTLLGPMALRFKILAGLDITERRRPQDGRISLPLSKRAIDFRLSTVPTIYGEKIVLRVLGQLKAQSVPDLQDLGFSASVFHELQELIARPNGIFLVTGPTGSGKTTTLFSLLKELNTPQVNIVTIEDPVEYRLKGVNQTQVNRSAQYSFTTALRSLLRQDPDIILVGEIRDVETAKMATQAAMTGHLVLSTMHTNSALQAVIRLGEMGVEPYLIAPTLMGVQAQRLVRRLCPHCKTPVQLDAEALEAWFTGVEDDDAVTMHQAQGCKLCHNSGYSGRLALQELLPVDAQFRRLIAKEASTLEFQRLAQERGMRTMHYDGIKKVLRGLTTMAEVERVAVARGT